MVETYRELGFDALLTITSGLALAAYMLGVLLDPVPAVVAGVILVGVGVLTLVPRQARILAAALGIVAVGLAGIVIPRVIDSFIETPATNELMLALVISGVVLLFTFMLLRLTAFQTQNGNPT